MKRVYKKYMRAEEWERAYDIYYIIKQVINKKYLITTSLKEIYGDIEKNCVK